MINNRRSFLKGVAGAFSMIAGGALLPKVSNANADTNVNDKMLLVDGKEVCEYLSAIVQPDHLFVRLKNGDEGWKGMLAIEPLFIKGKQRKATIELCNNGYARRWLCKWAGSSHVPRTDIGGEYYMDFWTDYEMMV